MPDLLVVADDLTGALDTGAAFACWGLRTLVAWGADLPPSADVWVLDTESRDLAPDEAREAIEALVRPLLSQVPRVYKKIDSTLRGNVGAELAALLDMGATPRAILAPAFPAQGRTTQGGQQWVHGRPLAMTPFAQPGVDCSSIAALLHSQMSLPVSCVGLDAVRLGPKALAQLLRNAPGPLLIVDAVEDAHLATIAEAATIAGMDRLLAGSAGLAAQLPPVWGMQTRPTPPAHVSAGPTLIVAGTRHPGLTAQLSRLQAGAPVAVVGDVLRGLVAGGGTLIAQRSEEVVAALLAGRHVVLTTAGEPLLAGASRSVAGLLAEVAARAVRHFAPAALILTGGDVAVAVCRALAARAVAIERQLEPGIPLGRLVGGAADGLPVVTKAGGFGDDEVLFRILQRLAEGAGELPGSEDD